MTKRKPARELKDGDLFRRVFPKPVRDEIEKTKPAPKKSKKKAARRHKGK